MLFNSIEFLFFLPIVFLLYWLCLKKRMGRNLLLLAASYFFYGWWSPKFLFLIIFISLCSFASGYYIENLISRGKLKGAKAVCGANIFINIAILGLFKYFNFFSHSFAAAMRSIGWDVDDVTLDLILPVGISFYTFQALSYTIDVYRGNIRTTKDIIAFLVFIGFFPQLVAGPIERATNLLPQFLRLNRFDYTEAVSGMRLILWGLFKKMVVADNAATAVDIIFGNYITVGTFNLWVGAFLFSIQIYCDFSGYSDIAIGVGRLFGIRLMRNFNFPYLSKNIHDFWRRWHISLTGWFRDYIYIPLGGNRKGKKRTMANMLTVFTISGLWHGANFTFILWGLYHGLMHIPYIIRGKRNKESDKEKPRGRKIIMSTLMMGLTFLIVMIGWILFRADTLSQAWHYICDMFTYSAPIDCPVFIGKMPLIFCVLLLILEVFSRHHETPFDFDGKMCSLSKYKAFRWSVYVLFFLGTLIFSGTSEQFIYFQF